MSSEPNLSTLRNGVSIVGAFLTTIAAVVFLVVFLADLFGLHTNPYLGIVVFLILPAVFVIGLLLIPIGGALERRRRSQGRAAAAWPRIDLNESHSRQRLLAILALTAANLVIVSLASYKGIEYMDTPAFCGQVCHVPMKPESVAYQSATHAKVACVECHVAPGASGLFEAKLSGVRRLSAAVRGTYQRPIPPPVGDRIPARDTCEQCHWPEKLHGDIVKRVFEYASDENNSETITTVRLHVGGGSERLGVATGIHWHMNVANDIEYVATDAAFQTIPYVRLKDRSGAVREYVSPGVTAEQIAGGQRRRMDCMDCHNRPAHPIAASAGRAIDERIAIGQIPKDLPFVRREAIKALETEYASEAQAMDGIAKALGDFYLTSYKEATTSRQPDVQRAVQTVQTVYRNNVFPEMKVTFGTYVNNIGHVESPGCFRCHDDEKATKEGRKLGQDCELCHSIE